MFVKKNQKKGPKHLLPIYLIALGRRKYFLSKNIIHKGIIVITNNLNMFGMCKSI